MKESSNKDVKVINFSSCSLENMIKYSQSLQEQIESARYEIMTRKYLKKGEVPSAPQEISIPELHEIKTPLEPSRDKNSSKMIK